MNAAIPPELEPAMARSFGSFESLYCLPTSGRISSIRKRAFRRTEAVVLVAAIEAAHLLVRARRA